MTKYHELFEILKDEVISENGTYSLSAPENADVLRRAQECVNEIEKDKKDENGVYYDNLEKRRTRGCGLNSNKIKCYAFNVFGEVKHFANYKECAEAIGIPKPSMAKVIDQKYWVNNRWQIRRDDERADLAKISKSKLLRFKKDGVEKIQTNSEFAKEMGFKSTAVSYAFKNKKTLDGWSIERIAINTNKLIENGVAI